MSKVSQVRQNFHQESEAGVNKQINLELYASYVYLQMVSLMTSPNRIGNLTPLFT